jgi:molecular chaperone DnaJ
MIETDHYIVLGVLDTATQKEIKQAYRQLAKQHHPDSRQTGDSHDAIAQINAAYEVLGDPQRRSQYDQQRRYLRQAQAAGLEVEPDRRTRHERTVEVHNYYRQRRQAAQTADWQQQQWMKQVYNPVDRLMGKILNPLKAQVRALSADPFDDQLMTDFQGYLEDCREALDQAQQKFKSMPNPSPAAGIAAHLYYCMNHLEDGLEEMERFTYTYDEGYLHTGQELFRISQQLRREASAAVKNLH